MRKVGTTRRGALLALVFALAVLLPTSALAAKGLGPGVHVDPSSPAAKEYQIPLGAARGNGQSGSSSPKNLFGQGITPVQSDNSSTGTTATSTTSTTATPPAHTASKHHKAKTRKHRRLHRRNNVGGAGAPAGGSGPGAAQTPSPAREIGTGSGGGTGITWMLGAAVAVLLLGGLGGSFLARRDRRASQPKQASQTSPYVS